MDAIVGRREGAQEILSRGLKEFLLTCWDVRRNVASRARTLRHIGVHFFGGALEILPSMISISTSCAETRKLGYIDGKDGEPTFSNEGATFFVDIVWYQWCNQIFALYVCFRMSTLGESDQIQAKLLFQTCLGSYVAPTLPVSELELGRR
jgi:hypothetical protein